MLKRYSLLVGLLLLTWAGQAQNYRPFRTGLAHQISESGSPGDTAHVLTTAFGYRQGTDSVFFFPRRTGKERLGMMCGQYVERRNNLFGEGFITHANAAFEFQVWVSMPRVGSFAIPFELRPRAPLGQVWTAVDNVTAQVTARSWGTVLGRPDSLVTITLSDGNAIVLSKNHGWVSGPAVAPYIEPRLPRKQLVLTAFPEQRIGAAVTGPFVVYDYQPGDVFLRRKNEGGMTFPCPATTWIRDSVLSRYDSPRGDTIRYQLRHRELLQTCNNYSSLGAYSVQTLLITSASNQLGYLTDVWGTPFGAGAPAALFHAPVYRTADYGGRPVQQHIQLFRCASSVQGTDSTYLMNAEAVDAGFLVETAPGLGETLRSYTDFTYSTTRLVGYEKGGQRWGQLTSFAQLLPVGRARALAAVAAVPNPFQQELTVQFELLRSQAVALELRDLLGRVVLARPATLQAAGSATIQLATQQLPVGLYTLRLLPADGPAQTLKVLKN